MTTEQLAAMLLDYGFSPAQVEEILARVAYGASLDNAMQSV